MPKQNITLAIVTYRRPYLLNKCLHSLSKQSVSPSQIIIVDNDPQKSAYSLYQKYQKKLPLSYYFESKKGAPNVRNTAISLVKTKYIAFIDDDCILDKNWCQEILSEINTNNVIFTIGTSLLQNKNNVFAQTQFNYYQQWFNSQAKTNPFSPELFDTKNIIINCQLFKKNKLIHSKL